MERRQLVSVVEREANVYATGQGQGHYGHDCDWSILQAVTASGQRYTCHNKV